MRNDELNINKVKIVVIYLNNFFLKISPIVSLENLILIQWVFQVQVINFPLKTSILIN